MQPKKRKALAKKMTEEREQKRAFADESSDEEVTVVSMGKLTLGRVGKLKTRFLGMTPGPGGCLIIHRLPVMTKKIWKN